MFHDKANDLSSGIVEQQVADTPELPPGVGGDHGPPDYIGCALRHRVLLGSFVRMIRAYRVGPRRRIAEYCPAAARTELTVRFIAGHGIREIKDAIARAVLERF